MRDTNKKRLTALAVIGLVVLALIIGNSYAARRLTFNSEPQKQGFKAVGIAQGRFSPIGTTPEQPTLVIDTVPKTVTTTTEPIQVSSTVVSRDDVNIEECQKHIVDDADFNPVYCQGVSEDDLRLNDSYSIMWARMADCVQGEIESGVACNYGTAIQHRNLLARYEITQ